MIHHHEMEVIIIAQHLVTIVIIHSEARQRHTILLVSTSPRRRNLCISIIGPKIPVAPCNPRFSIEQVGDVLVSEHFWFHAELTANTKTFHLMRSAQRFSKRAKLSIRQHASAHRPKRHSDGSGGDIADPYLGGVFLHVSGEFISFGVHK